MSELEVKTGADPFAAEAIGNAKMHALKAIAGLVQQRIEFAEFEVGGHRYDLTCVESEDAIEFTFKVKKIADQARDE